jgi:queuine tRNA-ribosyltransferase
MEEARKAIQEDRFLDFKNDFFEKHGLNTTNPKGF